MTFNDFGMYVGAMMDGVPPGQLPRMMGMAKAASAPAADAMYRMVLKVAADMMGQSEFARQAPALHLKIASQSKNAAHASHQRELVDIVVNAMRLLAPLYKQAGVVDAAVNGLKTLGQAAVVVPTAVGGGVGSGLWKLRRELQAGDLPVQAQHQNADYYRKLTHEINRQLREKYPYGDSQGDAAATSAAPVSGASRRRASAIRKLVMDAQRTSPQPTSDTSAAASFTS